jgi:hypothetical protein
MAKLKDLKKKITKLEASIQKDTKKLAKLKQKAEEKASKARLAAAEQKTQAAKTTPAPKKQGTITPEGRARLSALMKAKWAEKKKAEGQHTLTSSGKPEFKAA